MRKLYIVFFFSLLFLQLPLQAQEQSTEMNPLSIRPVAKSRIPYKKVLWWRIDLNEKQNRSFLARGFEMSVIIVEATKEGLLTPYTNDSVNVKMPLDEFLQAITLPEETGGLTEEEKALGFSDDWGGDEGGWGDEGDAAAVEEEVEEADEYDPRDFSVVELKEDWFFDKLRSRMYHDIHSVTLVLPADKNPALYEKPIASFRYVDLVELFKSMPEVAIWYNYKNSAAHLNMADAFDLRLFNGVLVKISNPDDNRIVDIYGESRKEAIMASQYLEHQLVDFETQLWEY